MIFIFLILTDCKSKTLIFIYKILLEFISKIFLKINLYYVKVTFFIYLRLTKVINFMTDKEYNKCIDLFSDNVYRFILKNIRIKEKAEDIIQDTFEKLWKNHNNINFSKAKSYIFSTAYHTMIDTIRKNKRNSEYEAIVEPSHEKQYSDLSEILDKAINLLPEIKRTVILLRDYEGYSYKEIGKITGLNESQVKVTIYRARVFLKNYIKDIKYVL